MSDADRIQSVRALLAEFRRRRLTHVLVDAVERALDGAE